MKVLLAITRVRNQSMRQLAAALEDLDGVDGLRWDLDAFWDGPHDDIDVVHLHWPENLFEWREPEAGEMERLEAKLTEWGRRAALVITVHNRHPHGRDTETFHRLYRMVYRHVDGIIHHGRASVDEFTAAYPELAGLPSTIIPHGTYACLPNEISREDARRELGIGRDAFVPAFLGRLREPAEVRLLLRGFRHCTVPRRELLVAGKSPYRRRWTLAMNRLRFALRPRAHLVHGFVPDEDVQLYLNAADVVAIPRLQVLVSGTIALGFTFGRVVVGPDTGVVGEVLRETGNPVYEPGDARAFGRALDHAAELESAGKGGENRRFVMEHWAWERVAARHRDFFARVATARAAGTRG